MKNLLEYSRIILSALKKFANYSLDKIVFYSPYYLFIWYGFSIINTYYDNTIGINLKICAEIINFMMFSITLRVIISGFKSPRMLDFSVCFILLLWFIYYTSKDAANIGYEALQQFFYISVDLCTIAFLFNSFVEFIKETSFFKKHNKKIDTIYKFGIAFLFSISILIYSKLLRSYI
jgi:hypothetical protein